MLRASLSHPEVTLEVTGQCYARRVKCNKPRRVQEALRASHHYVPQQSKITAGHHQPTTMRAGSYAAGPRGQAGGPSTPPPDLPSLLLDRRIVYIGMPLVASVTELIVSELLWLQYADPQKPIFMYINSIGSQQDDQAIGFETEAYAIQDTMNVRSSILVPSISAVVRRRWQARLKCSSAQKCKVLKSLRPCRPL